MERKPILSIVLKYFRSFLPVMLVGHTAQKILMSWEAAAKAAISALLAKVGFAKNVFQLRKKLFLVPSKRDIGYAPCEQPYHLLHGKMTVNDETDVDIEMCTKSNALDLAHWFILYLNLGHIALFLSNDTLRILKKSWI